MTDLTVTYSPSVSLLTAHTPDAEDWLATHLDPDAPRLGTSYACDNRYLTPILEALDAEGYTLTLEPSL